MASSYSEDHYLGKLEFTLAVQFRPTPVVAPFYKLECILPEKASTQVPFFKFFSQMVFKEKDF